MADMNCSTEAVSTSINDSGDETIELPIVVSYLILLFRIISTVYVTVIGIAVSIVVIKEKNKFKGRSVLLIVNLMVSGILSAVNATLQSSIMIISYIAGMDDPIRCDILFVTLSTFHINAFAFFMLAIDKFVAIAFPLRYISIVTDRVVRIMIFASWAISCITSTARMFIGETYTKSSQYGVCVPTQESFLSLMINFIAPIVFSFTGALIIDIYSSILACKLNYRFRRNDLEGVQDTSSPECASTSRLGRLKQRLDRMTGYNTRPILAVLIAVASNGLLGFLCPVLFVTVNAPEANATYKFYIEHIIIPNAAYCFLIVYSLIFSLYFKNIRVPLCKMMKPLIRLVCPLCAKCKCNVELIRQRIQLARRIRVAPVSDVPAQLTTCL